MSWKWWVITGKRLAAWTIPYPIRWVKETFLPLAASWALSALRRASSVVAEMSRKEVAVGTVSESVMLATNRAAGPVMGLTPGGRGTGEEGRVLPERSEEHTSELQSRLHLVCRLLLEKKKQQR